MRKYLFLIMLLASAITASAQDVIVKKDGSTILSKVIEIGTTEVKYKKWNNLNGPNYTISKSEVQTINYENGEKETFDEEVVTQPQQQFNYTDYQSQMAESMAASNRLQREKLLSSAKSWRRAGGWVWGISFVGGIIVGLCLDDTIGDTDAGMFDHGTYWLCCGAGLVVGTGGMLICYSIANNKDHLANTITASHIIQQDFNIGNSRLSAGIDLMNDRKTRDKALGLGLTLNF